MVAKVLGLGVKFSGNCAKCGRPTGSRDFEKAETLLLKTEDGFRVAHPVCCGLKTKHKIGGGIKLCSSATEVEI